MSNHLKKIFSITVLLMIAYKVFAPGAVSLVIKYTPPVEPFKRLIHAIGKVETSSDTLAYNPLEEAVGYFQIRPIRVADYNRRTGSTYSTKDMFNYKISEKVFLYYAIQIGPYNFEQIARNWNGSGNSTLQYWAEVKKCL
jgi:hypothetical protein